MHVDRARAVGVVRLPYGDRVRRKLQVGEDTPHRALSVRRPLIEVEQQQLAQRHDLKVVAQVAAVPPLTNERVDIAAITIHVVVVFVHHRKGAVRPAARLRHAEHTSVGRREHAC